MPQVPSRSETIRARVTPAEKSAVEGAAQRRGMKPSEYVRGRTLGLIDADTPIVPPEPLEAPTPISTAVPNPPPATEQRDYLTAEQWDREVRGRQSMGSTRPAAAAEVRERFGPRPDEAA